MDQFPWDRYDQVPPQYYDQIPAPWGTTRNALNKLLGGIGIGGKAKLAVVSDGRIHEYPFTVTAAPDSFETGEKFNDSKLGSSRRIPASWSRRSRRAAVPPWPASSRMRSSPLLTANP